MTATINTAKIGSMFIFFTVDTRIGTYVYKSLGVREDRQMPRGSRRDLLDVVRNFILRFLICHVKKVSKFFFRPYN